MSILAANTPTINFQNFLLAMSSSRSDVVTQLVRVSVCVSLCILLVSFEFYLVLKSFN